MKKTKNNMPGYNWNCQMSRYFYLKGDLKNFYRYIIISRWTIKNFGMLLTAWPKYLREYVKSKCNILDPNHENVK